MNSGHFPRIVFECYHDAALLRALGVPEANLALGHVGNKGMVLNTLAKLSEDAVGVIDADPKRAQPRKLKDYHYVDERHGLKLLGHQTESPHQRLIVISPYLEKWLLVRASACGLAPSEYNLPDIAGELHKNPRRDQDPGFCRFLQDLGAQDDAFTLLRRWLSEAES